ncbi:MAG: hypothetical protein LBE91_05290 [Tannerella sp.]|jgi:hypothetical protein|nr:hypothetical protein [Tannerella sp.]
MENAKKVTVNIVNRDYPPYKGITGESAAELARYLLDAGFEVNVVHVDSSFLGKNENLPAGNIFKVKTLYNGESKLPRLFANILSGYFLIRKSKKINCDVTIVMTDPGLLNMWASLLLKKRKWILWSMDLYPEAFAAWGLISGKSFPYKLFYKLTVKNSPQSVISLGPLQTGFISKRYNNQSIKFFQLPCGIFHIGNLASDIPPWATDRTKTILGYIGNLGAPHSLDFLYAIVDRLDAEKFKLVLSVYGYGTKIQSLKQYVSGKEGIEIIPPVKREHLKYIDIHLASLLSQCTHISVPSKTVSSVCAGSAFLYCGEAESDNWYLLKDAGWLIPAETDVTEGVKHFFENFDLKNLEDKKEAARTLSGKLNSGKAETFQKISDFLSLN